MKLNGIHHITAITADAQRNIDFYAGVLGLRLVKKSVNQDEPSVYHLFYADEQGSPGADMTFFEFPYAAPGRPGAGMIHRITWRVASTDAFGFWERRLAEAGVQAEATDEYLRFSDPEGLAHEFVVADVPDQPLIADHPEVPREFAIQGFHGVRAYAFAPERSKRFFEETLGFEPNGDGWEVRGATRGGLYAYDEAPAERGLQGAGTVHHVAWYSETEDHEPWRERIAAAGARPTPVIDRFWFRSVYFREPNGILFELATPDPGFAVDEDPEHLGEKLILPPFLEDKREQIEAILKPVRNPRQSARA